MGTLYTRLSSITGEMSPESIEHHIARVMLEHIHQLNNISIGAMADLCSVSKSTISKFVKQLGFEDYKEFKAEAYSRGKRSKYDKYYRLYIAKRNGRIFGCAVFRYSLFIFQY